MEYTPETINIKVYTPAGYSAFITLPFGDKMPSANDVDTLISGLGYLPTLPGIEPGEEAETMTHVMKRIHTNKDNGTKTPVIAFYHENPKLKHKYDHVYMNTPEQIAEFEQLGGLKLSEIPEYMGDNYLARDHERAAQFIVPLKTPIRVVAIEKPYEAFGRTGTTMKIQRFLGASAPQQQQAPSNADSNKIIDMPSGNAKFTAETAQAFSDYWKKEGVAPNEVLGILGVSKLSEWQRTVDDANTLLAERVG